MSTKKLYMQAALLTGRSYIGYVMDDFSPNFNDDMSFILYNAHCFYTRLNKNGEPTVELVSIEDTPESFAPDMEIMWQAVATIQYLDDDSYIVKNIENKNKDTDNAKEKDKNNDKKQPNLIVLKNEVNKT